MKLRRGSLFFRTALTLALVLVVFQAAGVWVLYRTVIVPVAEQSADDLAGLIVLSAQTWVELPPATRSAFENELSRRHGLTLRAGAPGANVEREAVAAAFSFHQEIEDALSDRLDEDVTLVSLPGEAKVWVAVPVGEHQLWIGFLPARYAVELPLAGLALLAIGTLLSLLAAVFLVSRLTVPLARAAAAARQVGAGQTPAPLPETGPSELVELARRFNHMARQVRELLDNRTTMLAGISHDLRTPMTRLGLNLELLRDAPAPERIDRALADLEAMNRLISAYMELARSARAEAKVDCDLVPLLAELAAEAGAIWQGGRAGEATAGQVASASGGAAVAACQVAVAPLALRQVLRNLLQNARRYGGERPPELLLEAAAGQVRIVVRDFGPGIPPAELDKVFRPFYRLEASRSASTGGSGLGLAIARQLADSQGWRLGLQNRAAGPDCGLDAWLEIERTLS